MENVRKMLAELGLSSYKIETYISLLRIGSGTIQQIAKTSHVPACKLYENLKWLYEHGYISLMLEKPLTYKANDPKVIIQSELDKRKEALGGIERELATMKFHVPVHNKDFVQITGSRETFFTKMKESVVDCNSCISYIIGSWKLDSELVRLMKDRIRAGVKIRALGPVNEKTRVSAKVLKDIGVQVRDFVPGTTRFSVFDKQLVIIRLRSEEEGYYSVWIRSPVLAEILQDYFDNIWSRAK